ncbi:DUF4844 domain-containing protein [Empedobacter falsenii]
MRLKSILTLFFFSLSLLLIAQNNRKEMFEDFIKKEKFYSQENELSIKNLEPIVEKSLNRLASTFEFIDSSKNAETKHYLLAIKKTINELKPYEIDLSINDKTIISTYIEELMDFVDLESSEGLLNEFVYGFDPTKK